MSGIKRLAMALVAGSILTAVGLAVPQLASATTVPVWEPDSTNEVGTITLYDGAGSVVTSGNLTAAPMAAYAVGSANPNVTSDINGVAKLNGAQPNPGNAFPALWNTDQLSGGVGSGNYPVTGAGAPTAVKNLPTSEPVVTGSSGDLTLADFIVEFPNSDSSGPGCAYSANASGCTNTDYTNIYQLRIYTMDSSGTYSAKYDAADVMVTEIFNSGADSVTGTWEQIYPAPAGTVATHVALSASPSSPVKQGSHVVLTATVTADDSTKPAGTVQFGANGKSIGLPATVNTSTGIATLTTSALPAGADSLTASFTPTNGATYESSMATPVDFTVNPVAPTPKVTGSSKVGATDKCVAKPAGNETASYKWLVSGSKVATGTSYKIPASAYKKQLSCSLTVQIGSGPANTAVSTAVKVKRGAALKATKKPTLTGSGKVGGKEKAHKGSWSPKAKSYTYEWLLNGKAIKHATKSSFKITSADRGKKLSCKVTATAKGYAKGHATTKAVKVKS